MDLGTTIKKLRNQKDMTQEDLAGICGITQTYLSQIENNQREPNLSTLKVISEKLEMPLPIIFYLSMNADDVPEEKRKAFEMVSPSVKSLVNAFFAV
ncbi:MAG: helix-turn-helix domain-containing protein [Cyclobacteriaceae bacterium]|nr:helix-turn-helix domain-containing protein [Cyclobacteriaceae bacterium]